MGNCCTGSPTSDHPFTPDRASLRPPQTAFTNSSPSPSNTAATQPTDMTSSFTGVRGVEATDSVVVDRAPDALIHMADREGTLDMCMCMCVNSGIP